MEVYHNPITKKYYGIDMQCTNCNKEIMGEMALLHYCWFDRKKDIPSKCEVLCIKCAKHRFKLFEVEESYQLICIPKKKMPIGLIPWSHYKCELMDGNCITVFDAAFLLSDRTIDRTRYAGRESWQGSQIGLTKDQTLEYDQEHKKETENTTKYLKILKKSVPEVQKQSENKK